VYRLWTRAEVPAPGAGIARADRLSHPGDPLTFAPDILECEAGQVGQRRGPRQARTPLGTSSRSGYGPTPHCISAHHAKCRRASCSRSPGGSAGRPRVTLRIGGIPPRVELAVAPTGPAVRLEQGHGRPLSGIAVIRHGGRPRGPGLRPAALGSRLVLLRACPGGPGAGPRWFGTEWTELLAHAKRYANTCGWPATSSSACSSIRQLVRAPCRLRC
jgi:hypothetical protein